MRLPPLLTLFLVPALAMAAQPKKPAFDIGEAGVAELQARMHDGRLDSQALTRAYLRRIARIDKAGPRLNSIIELNPDAMKEAAALDRERRAGHVRGPLHGIPVLLKDNIDAVGMANSAGSLALADNRPDRDAPLVARLRAAGAVILGKTNLSEWANFRSAHASSGWSGRGGQTRNPYVLDRNPCGSSAGTGSAIAAGLATVGVGTETDGSILCPASMAGLVGLKPTLGLVSRTGIIPIAHSQDTAGPMARSVADAAALLTAMAGSDPRDPATKDADAHRHDYGANLHANGLRGKRIGVVRKLAGMEPNADRVLETAIAALRAQGAIIVDPVAVPNIDTLGDAEMTVMLHEFKDDLAAYLRDSNAKPKTLAALIAWNKAHADREMQWFGQDLFEKADAAGGQDERAYREALEKAKRLSGPEGIDAALRKDRLDALLAPSWGPAFPTDPILGDHIVSGDPTIGGVSQLPAIAGYPSITVPTGSAHGLPVGIMFIGTAWSEPVLLDIAHGYEQATRARTAPGFIPTIAP